jgi:hypothetical protein
MLVIIDIKPVWLVARPHVGVTRYVSEMWSRCLGFHDQDGEANVTDR